MTTASARNRLPPGKHWRRLDVDLHLGFYKRPGGEGTWIVRWYMGSQKYWQKEFAIVEGAQEQDGVRVIDYYVASKLARALVDGQKDKVIAELRGPATTVRDAVAEYVEDKARRQAARGMARTDDAERQLDKHVLSDEELASIPLYELQAETLAEWRSSLSKKVQRNGKPYSPSAIQRITTDFKAALNLAAVRHRKRLPQDFPIRIKDGLGATQSFAPMPRHGQALSDNEINLLVRAAQEIDDEEQWDGDLYRPTLVKAATGARFSQLRRVTVADVQIDRQRIMVPVSQKGRGEKSITHVPFRVDSDIIAILAPLVVSRSRNDPLFERWYHGHIWVDGIRTKIRKSRGPWNSASNFARPWRQIVERAGLSEEVVAYALRHTSIVRMLCHHVPVSLVAALHDTSEASIRKHYAAEIVDALDDVVAGVALKLDIMPPNVTAMHGQKRA